VAISRRYWFYIEESVETNLEMIDVQPHARWQKGRAMIATANDLDGNITQRSLARFRTKGEVSCDFVVVLELEVQRSQVQARCHVMTSSRDTALEDLSQKLIYIRPEAFGKQSATNGILNVYVTVRQESVVGQPMFVVRLAAMPSSPEVTIDATLELQQLDLKLEYVNILQKEDKIYLEAEQLGQQKEEKIAILEPMKGRLAVVEEKLRKLSEEKRLLIDGLEKGAQEVHQLTTRDNEIRQQQGKLSERRLEIQRRLDELLKNGFDMKRAPKDWFEAIAKMLLNAGNVDFDLKDIGDCDSDRTQLSRAAENGHNIYDKTSLSWAAVNGYEAVVKLLLEKGADVESKNWGGTPLGWAAARRHEAVVQLLLEKGVELETKDDSGRTPPSYVAGNGHEAVVKLLLKKGAELETKYKGVWTLALAPGGGRTPLSWAAGNGHEAVVKLLLDQGAKLETKYGGGRTPLSYAAENGHEAVVKLLLEKGARLETKSTRSGRTPLSWAAARGQEAVVKLLLEKDAKLETKDDRGRTPLS
jgi:ankyrin repeat protein